MTDAEWIKLIERHNDGNGNITITNWWWKHYMNMINDGINPCTWIRPYPHTCECHGVEKCASMDSCFKISMIMDKDILDFQKAAAIKSVCENCND